MFYPIVKDKHWYKSLKKWVLRWDTLQIRTDKSVIPWNSLLNTMSIVYMLYVFALLIWSKRDDIANIVCTCRLRDPNTLFTKLKQTNKEPHSHVHHSILYFTLANWVVCLCCSICCCYWCTSQKPAHKNKNKNIVMRVRSYKSIHYYCYTHICVHLMQFLLL